MTRDQISRAQQVAQKLGKAFPAAIASGDDLRANRMMVLTTALEERCVGAPTAGSKMINTSSDPDPELENLISEAEALLA